MRSSILSGMKNAPYPFTRLSMNNQDFNFKDIDSLSENEQPSNLRDELTSLLRSVLETFPYLQSVYDTYMENESGPKEPSVLLSWLLSHKSLVK